MKNFGGKLNRVLKISSKRIGKKCESTKKQPKKVDRVISSVYFINIFIEKEDRGAIV